MKTTQYLDAAKKRLGLPSDYALAKHLGLTQQAVSKMRRGVAVMSNTTAAKLASILELEPMRAIADAELERGADSELWKRIRDAAIVATMAIGAASFGAPAPLQAATLHNYFSPSVGAQYALPTKKRRRGLAHWLDVLLGR